MHSILKRQADLSQKIEIENELCGRLLRAGAAGQHGSPLREIIEPLVELIRHCSFGITIAWRELHDLAVEAEDVTQDVFLRLYESPPTDAQSSNPRATVRGWVRSRRAQYRWRNMGGAVVSSKQN